MEGIIILVTGSLVITAYTLGLRIGQKLSKGEVINIKELNPIQMVSRKMDEQTMNEELEKLNKVLDNIENYTGDSKGQKEVI
jgi:hypothetical protein